MSEQLFTQREVDNAKAHAVLEAKMERLEGIVPKLFELIEGLDSKVDGIPMEIVSCRDRMEKDLKAYMHKTFMEEHKVKSMFNKQLWVLGGMCIAFTVVNFLITKTSFFGVMI